MIISQTINHLNENNYDVDIRVTDIPVGSFLSFGATSFSGDDFMREIEVEILPLDDATGGTKNTNSGVFSRRENESVIKVTVFQNGSILGRNNQVY
jgi:hypothetical protein